MTTQEIINYIMHTPENTNPAVLKDILKQISNSDGLTTEEDFINNILFVKIFFDNDDLTYKGNITGTDLMTAFTSNKCIIVQYKKDNNILYDLIIHYEYADHYGQYYFYGFYKVTLTYHIGMPDLLCYATF